MKIERVTDFDRFKRLRDEWNELVFLSEVNSIFLTHEWFAAWWSSFSDGLDLEILLIRDESGALQGIAPFMGKDGELGFIANHEVTDYCDLILHPDRKEELYDNIMEQIRSFNPGFDRVKLINIKESSSTLSMLSTIAPKFRFSCVSEESEKVPALELPESYSDYVENLSRKNRHELHRKLKKMDKLGGVRVERVTRTEALLKFLETFIELHRRSSPRKEAFWKKTGTEIFFKNVISLFALRGWVELSLLYSGGTVLAALLNFVYQDEILIYNSAFAPEYAAFNPGWYIFNHVIRSAISSRIKRVDFLRGDERYKYSFGAKEGKIYNLVLKHKA